MGGERTGAGSTTKEVLRLVSFKGSREGGSDRSYGGCKGGCLSLRLSRDKAGRGLGFIEDEGRGDMESLRLFSADAMPTSL